MVASVTSPVNVIIRWKGRAITAVTLCASSQDRCPLLKRSMKKSAKIFLWVMMPVTRPSSMIRAQNVDSQRPYG